MPGDRRPTLSDVAARAGVSKSLVSLVMRDEPGAGPETRRRVLDAAAELGYQPDSRARLLRSGRSRLLGVVFGIQHAFHADLVTDLYTAARETGYELALSAVTPHRAEPEAITGLLQDRCEALILLGPQSPVASLARLAERLPVVAVARGVRSPAIDVVRNADADGLRRAVDHLVELGHRRIAHIDGGRAPGAADRRSGYRDAMRRHALGEGEGEWRGEGERRGQAERRGEGNPRGEGTRGGRGRRGGGDGIRIVRGGLTEEDGAAAARALLEDLPTAITVFNDRCATGVLDVLAREGLKVPGDVSVVGYDDSHLARLAHVDLTTIAQDTAMMSRLAVGRAVARVEGEPVQQREQVVAPHLVVRGTTGPVRAGRPRPRSRR
ncbi:LacI family DNA-binding transcriptional regulator [Actinoplanes sp. CA-030573]|uniref:LacI family DNA-binding transcriptional regulator n=1 Tax=Actinoplanes sp. CA-030573 TaxID=3239898 RepID=UPI003D8B89EC